jgi:ferric-dicitrate binding protein FerR (iron transport regulator)
LSPDATGWAVAAGSTVETASAEGGGEPGRLALSMTSGASLRLDAGTRLCLASAERVELTRGAVYVDRGADRGGRPLAVATPAGVFHELGTQFEVRVEGDGAEAITRLRVREGRVALDGGGAQGTAAVVATAGEELIVRADGSLVHGEVANHGPAWDWVVATAPMLEIEGLTVRAFLDWIARETGLRIEFADPDAAALADKVTLHGSIAHLTLPEALDPVLSSAGLDHRVSDGTLVILAEEDGR